MKIIYMATLHTWSYEIVSYLHYFMLSYKEPIPLSSKLFCYILILDWGGKLKAFLHLHKDSALYDKMIKNAERASIDDGNENSFAFAEQPLRGPYVNMYILGGGHSLLGREGAV